MIWRIFHKTKYAINQVNQSPNPVLSTDSRTDLIRKTHNKTAKLKPLFFLKMSHIIYEAQDTLT